VFVGDVVAANMLLSEAELPDAGDLDQRAFNVGTEIETSVRQLAESLMSVANMSVEVQYATARAGELRHSCLDTSQLRGCGWQPGLSLNEGMAVTYEYIVNKEKGW